MPYPLPLTRTEAYLAYKAGVIQQSDLKPSLAVPRNGIDAWLAYWTGLAENYPKKPTVNLFDKNEITVGVRVSTSNGGTYPQAGYAVSSFIPISPLTTYALVCGTAAGGSFFSWYDSSKHYISGSGWQNKRTWKSPANARYIKFDFKVSEKDIVQFEKAPLSPYSPYTTEPLILQEEEAYIAYLCGVINEYPEKCLRRVGAYLRYLISARWGRPDHPLNREELYLSLIKTQFIPSGDPSSDIEIDGTAKAAFVDVKMYGDTAQNSYTGKNLTPNIGSLSWSSNNITNKVIGDDEITFTTSGSTNFSGVYMVKTTNYDICKYYFEDGYTVSFEISASKQTNFTIGQSGGTQTAYTVGTTPVRISTASDNANFVIYATSRNGASVSIKNIQVESGSTATDYEPFVGGQPSPNPDYPQPIQTVTGLQTVTVTGKNKINMPYRESKWDGASVLQNGTTLTMKPNSTSGMSMSYSTPAIPVAIPTGETITWSRTWLGGGTWNSGAFTFPLELTYIDGTKETISLGDTTKNNYLVAASRSVTLAKDVVSVRLLNALCYSIKEMTGDIVFGVQLEYGSTATDYEPYSSNDYEINLGKNLFDKSSQVKGYLNTDGVVINTSSKSDRTSVFIKAEPNTAYTLSSPGWWLKIAQYDSSQSFIRIDQSGANISAKTVTTQSNTAYIRISYGNAQNSPDVQLELGSQATSYAPYFEPIELCKLGTYQDYIWKDQDEWKIRKNTSRFTFKTRKLMGLSKQNLGFVYNLDNNPLVGKHIPLVGDCSHFDVEPTTTTWTTLNKVGMNTVGALWFRTTDTNQGDSRTIEEFAQWLVDAGVSFVYALATPTDTVITDQNLIDQLNALKQGGAEEGTTYIKVSATDPNLPGLLYVEAPKYE